MNIEHRGVPLTPSRVRALAVLFCWWGLLGCTARDALVPRDDLAMASDEVPVVGARTEKAIYGEDNRYPVREYSDVAWGARASEFSVALLRAEDVVIDGDTAVVPEATLADQGICADEPFASQPVAAFCSGTLVADNVVVTAGHCVTYQVECDALALVFGYEMADAQNLASISAADVYGCRRILARSGPELNDYAVIELDRPVPDRNPATMRRADAAMTEGTPVIMNGYPSGLPLVVTDQAEVLSPGGADRGSFLTNLDAFAGNSGSGVFSTDGELVGLLVSGEEDFRWDDGARCLRMNNCDAQTCRGENVTYGFRVAEAVCQTIGAPFCECGDGVCDQASGEESSWCARDCGHVCGDGACTGDEDTATCPQDCDVCGNGVCAGDETPGRCCVDCGCDGEAECDAGVCVPPPGEGDNCDNALTIFPRRDLSNRYVGSTTYAYADLQGSCGGAAGRDRVYAMELDYTANLRIRVIGFDSVVYLQTTCADPSTELGCNDDDPAQQGGSSLLELNNVTPGTYYLVVDGYDTDSGNYTLSIDSICVDGCRTDEGSCAVIAPGRPGGTRPWWGGALFVGAFVLWRRRKRPSVA